MLVIFTNPLNYPRCVIQFVLSCYTWKQTLNSNLEAYQDELDLQKEGFVMEEEAAIEDFLYHLNPFNRGEHPSHFGYDDGLFKTPVT